MSEFEHLQKHAAEVADETQAADTLVRVSQLVEQWLEAKAEVDRLELELSEAKGRFNQVSQKDIPEALLTTGLSEVRLADGKKVIVTDEVYASVKDYDLFSEFLDKRGDSAILKTTIELGKLPKPILKKLVKVIYDDFGILTEAIQKVHPATLNKYIRELCGIGGKTEAKMLLEDLDKNMVSTYTFHKTNIK